MANLCLAALEQLREFLTASDGVNAELAVIGARDMVFLRPLARETVLIEHVAAKIADESSASVYPVLYLYCTWMDNGLTRKFTKFSGPIHVLVDVRVSGEDFAGLDSQLVRYVEAVGAVLGDHQGKWTGNITFAGAYKVKFKAAELGGQNFIQRAEIEVELLGYDDG